MISTFKSASQLATPQLDNAWLYQNAYQHRLNINGIIDIVVNEVIAVHGALGHGLSAIVYETILANVLRKRGLRVERKPSIHTDTAGASAFKNTIVIEDKAVIEMVSAKKIQEDPRMRMRASMAAKGYQLGFHLNFGELRMNDGIAVVMNELGIGHLL